MSGMRVWIIILPEEFYAFNEAFKILLERFNMLMLKGWVRRVS